MSWDRSSGSRRVFTEGEYLDLNQVIRLIMFQAYFVLIVILNMWGNLGDIRHRYCSSHQRSAMIP